VLAGVDGSSESKEAAKQAAILTHGPLTLLTAYDIAPPIIGATWPSVPAYLDVDVQRIHAEEVLAEALTALPYDRATGKFGRGAPWDVLVREARLGRHTVIVVGSHGVGHARGIFLGSTVTELVHRAPCSVLVARGGGRVPARIVVGVDGSPESATAYRAARELADRFDATLRPLVARDDDVNLALVEAIGGEALKDSPRDPVQALVNAGDVADLVIVGSRGLHGLKALGSVSEQVAHKARCPVLVVRVAPWQRAEEAEVAAE
jgi:nucleotide-binding universal stress UspA family protein